MWFIIIIGIIIFIFSVIRSNHAAQKEKELKRERWREKCRAENERQKNETVSNPSNNSPHSNQQIEAFKASETNEPYFFIFDCETTGLPRFDEIVRIVQLSWIILDKDFNWIKEASYYLNPGMHILSAATAIHHITDEMVQEKSLPHRDVLTEFYNDLEQSKWIVAHNFKFDAERIDFETKKINLKMRTVLGRPNSFCTMLRSTDFCKLGPKRYGEYKWPKLEELALECGFQVRGLHDASVDVRVTGLCLKRMVEKGWIRKTEFSEKKTPTDHRSEHLRKSGERVIEIMRQNEIEREQKRLRKNAEQGHDEEYIYFYNQHKIKTLDELETYIDNMKDGSNWGSYKRQEYKVLQELKRTRISEKSNEINNIIKNELYTSYTTEQVYELNYYIQMYSINVDEKYKKFLNKLVDKEIYEKIKDYTPGRLQIFLNSMNESELGEEVLTFIHEKINSEPLLSKLIREKNNISSNIRKHRLAGNLDKVKEYEDLLEEKTKQIIIATNNNDANDSSLPDDIESLKKIKENIRIKLTKANNRLLYQSEKKEKDYNPMPEGVKRLLIEEKIEKLKKQKEIIDDRIKNLK
jgi:DNA polymerase III epsilon subunit-like protein